MGNEVVNMERSTKQTYEYQKGFADGFKEGYNKALEDMLIKKQYELSTNTSIIINKSSK
jgi:flagellar biosynthesis/type III secretory pathway protein FliH